MPNASVTTNLQIMNDDRRSLLGSNRPQTFISSGHSSKINDGVQIDITLVAKTCAFAMVFAFFSCILISMKKDWTSSTETHCHVPNYLPSISAAIGGYSPQKYIWRIAVAIAVSPRLLLAYTNLNHHLAQEYQLFDHYAYPLLCQLTFWVCVVENLALVLLTYVSSSEWFFIHKLGFGTFVFCSVLHQVLHLAICRVSVLKMEDLYLRRLVRLKTMISTAHVLSLLCAFYFYWRHNEYCEPGIYTFFAFFEYLVVLTNIGFHYTFVWDFQGSILSVTHLDRSQQFKISKA